MLSGARLNHEKDNCHLGSCSRFNGSYRATAPEIDSCTAVHDHTRTADRDRATADHACARVDGYFFAGHTGGSKRKRANSKIRDFASAFNRRRAGHQTEV